MNCYQEHYSTVAWSAWWALLCKDVDKSHGDVGDNSDVIASDKLPFLTAPELDSWMLPLHWVYEANKHICFGVSLSTGRKGFISFCLRVILRNHRGKFYEGLGQAHKSNEVLQVTFSGQSEPGFPIWLGIFRSHMLCLFLNGLRKCYFFLWIWNMLVPYER